MKIRKKTILDPVANVIVFVSNRARRLKILLFWGVVTLGAVQLLPVKMQKFYDARKKIPVEEKLFLCTLNNDINSTSIAKNKLSQASFKGKTPNTQPCPDSAYGNPRERFV